MGQKDASFTLAIGGFDPVLIFPRLKDFYSNKGRFYLQFSGRSPFKSAISEMCCHNVPLLNAYNFWTFPSCLSISIIFSYLNSNCSNLLDMRNLQEQVKKAFCYQKLFYPFAVSANCSSDLETFVNSPPSASNFNSFSRSLEHFFLIVGQNNFGDKILFLSCS